MITGYFLEKAFRGELVEIIASAIPNELEHFVQQIQIRVKPIVDNDSLRAFAVHRVINPTFDISTNVMEVPDLSFRVDDDCTVNYISWWVDSELMAANEIFPATLSKSGTKMTITDIKLRLE